MMSTGLRKIGRSGAFVRARARSISSVITLVLLVISTPLWALDAVWCAKPGGLLERNATYRSSANARALTASLADGHEYLYVTRTSSEAQARAAAGGLLIGLTRLDSKGAKELTPDEAEQLMNSPEARDTVRQIVDASKTAKTEPNWYFYSNSPSFGEYFKTMGLEIDASTGALLLMDADGERKLLPSVMQRLVKGIRPHVVVIDGPAPFQEVEFDAVGSRAPLVLKLNAAAGGERKPVQSAMTVASRLRNASSADTAVIFLMPETAKQATAWGFDEELATQYATNGRRILKDVDRYGLASAVAKTPTLAAATEAIRGAAAAGKKLIMIIGESSDGESVRIPGSSDVMRTSDITDVGNASLIGLVCNSQNLLGDKGGIGVIGTIYTDQLRSMARVLFDKRPAASVAEYLDIPYSKTATKDAVKASDVAAVAASNMTVPTSAGPRRAVLVTLTPPPPPPPPPSGTGSNLGTQGGSVADSSSGANVSKSPSGSGAAKQSSKDHSLGWLFAAGVLGAATREFFRWRRLSKRRRADLFRKPQYFLISMVQMILGGLAAMIFGPVVPFTWQLPVSFVCGAGLEELIRRATMLQVWTPVVPHGKRQPAKDTFLEYLRA
jgi:hypothetical protein